MGVKGLWKAFGGEGSVKVELKAFKHQRVAVDDWYMAFGVFASQIAGWLYRAVWRFALEFLLEHYDTDPADISLPPARVVLYEDAWRLIQHRLNLLLQAEVEPIFVFDGAPLKAKEEEHKRRREYRAVAAAGAVQLHEAGEASEALQAARRGLVVPHGFGLFVQKKLRGLGFVFVVAPYEADAQIARLVAEGIASAVLTEDGDLIAYGCKQVLSKLSSDGEVVLTDIKEILRSSRLLQKRQWSLESLQIACCLSGCDYFAKGVAGIGFTRAARLLAKHGPDVEAILRGLGASGRHVTARCMERMRMALLTYRHQTVFSLNEQGHIKTVPLTKPPVPLDAHTQQMLGPLLSTHVAAGVCGGFLHPMTLAPLSSDWIGNRESLGAVPLPSPATEQMPSAMATMTDFATPMKRNPGNRTTLRQTHLRCKPVPWTKRSGLVTHGAGGNERKGSGKAGRCEKEGRGNEALMACRDGNGMRNGCLVTRAKRQTYGAALARNIATGVIHGESCGECKNNTSYKEGGMQELKESRLSKLAYFSDDRGGFGKWQEEGELIAPDADQLPTGKRARAQKLLASLCPCKIRLLLSMPCNCKKTIHPAATIAICQGSREATESTEEPPERKPFAFAGGDNSLLAPGDNTEINATSGVERDADEEVLIDGVPTLQTEGILRNLQQEQRGMPQLKREQAGRHLTDRDEIKVQSPVERLRVVHHDTQDSLAPLFFQGKPLSCRVGADQHEFLV